MGEIWFGGKIQMMNPGCIALLWHFQSVKIENVKIKNVKLFLILTFEFYTLQNVRLKQHSPGTGLKTVARSIYKKALNAVQCTDKNQKLVIQKKKFEIYGNDWILSCKNYKKNMYNIFLIYSKMLYI